jgi:hypothetical protein
MSFPLCSTARINVGKMASQQAKNKLPNKLRRSKGVFPGAIN